MSNSIKPEKMRNDLFQIQNTINTMVWLIEKLKRPDLVHDFQNNLESFVSDLKKHCK